MKQRILSQILKTSAFQKTRIGSPEVPHSIDLMKLAGTAQALKETARSYQLLFRAENLHETQRIAGISPTGEVFAALLSYLEKKPLLWLGSREEPPQRRITGLVQPGDSVLLIDGIQEAATLAEAGRIIQAEGGVVNDALVLISDADTGSSSESMVKVHSLLSRSDIVYYLASKGVIKEQPATSRHSRS